LVDDESIYLWCPGPPSHHVNVPVFFVFCFFCFLFFFFNFLIFTLLLFFFFWLSWAHIQFYSRENPRCTIYLPRKKKHSCLTGHPCSLGIIYCPIHHHHYHWAGFGFKPRLKKKAN
jgi:hypothetical protein